MTDRKYIDAATAAKAIRADLKAAQKAGELHEAVRASVTIRRFTTGQSVDVRVTAMPFERGSDAATATLMMVRAIAARLHWEKRDTASDFYDCNFFLSVA
jgi:hypothetical protein